MIICKIQVATRWWGYTEVYPEKLHVTFYIHVFSLLIYIFFFSLQGDPYQVSFHLPLHRYYSVFMCQAVRAQGAQLSEVLPPQDLLHLIMVHPLRLQVRCSSIVVFVFLLYCIQLFEK